MLVPDPPRARELVAVERVDASRRLDQRGAEGAPDGGLGLRPLGLRHAELIGAEGDPVEALGQLQEGDVTVPADLVDDVGDPAEGLPGGGRGRAGEGLDDGGDAPLAEVGRGELPDHRTTPARSSSRSRLTAW